MANYKSKHTGADIDAAVSAFLAGGTGEGAVSPTATVTQTETGAVVTVTDVNGTTTATLTNGADGAPGAPGADGVSVSKVYQKTINLEDGGTNIVNIELTDGTFTSVKIRNGNKGSDGAPGADGADGNGIKSAVLNADYTLTLSFDDGTSYTTPSIRGAKGATGAAGAAGAAGADGKDARIVAQDTAPDDTSVLWVDTSDSGTTNPVYVNPLYGKKIVFNGDSICAGSEADGTLGGYGKIIADRNNMTYQNIATGGIAVTAGLCRTISNMDADADYAIIEGGINDSSYGKPVGAIIDGYSGTLDDTTYCGAFESMLKQLILRFPGKKIGYIAVHTNNDTFSNNTTDNYYTLAKQCCAKWGVPVCDLNANVPAIGRIPDLKSAYTVNGDGVHPTAEGYRLFYCDKIEAWLRTL